VLSHSLPGRKIEALRENPRACLQVDDIRDQLNWQSVILFGTYEEINGASGRARAMNLLLSLFPELTPVESLVVADANAPAPVVFRVKIERLTGITEG
jgi:nitroimidazol reductase NimA-like FMN-containing flavoprotein (pyridoxamine 5'-phosphate oxidase superfamily)